MLGAKTLIISNACGSMNPGIEKGSIMLIDDHINLLGDNPLRGINDERLGPRFVDLSQPYNRRLISLTANVAEELNLRIYEGVYAALCGPSLETRAEYRFLKTIGADVVGMSTVPETIVARQMGMEVLGLSIITDECDPDNLKPADIKDIINTAKNSEKDLTILISTLMKRL